MASDNSYVECLVSSKASPVMVVLKGVTLALTVIFVISALLLGFGIVGMILAIVAGVAYYFVSLNASIEFEYQYCDREITIDKVLNKSRRKNIGKYDVGRIEAMAQVSHIISMSTRIRHTRFWISLQERRIHSRIQLILYFMMVKRK